MPQELLVSHAEGVQGDRPFNSAPQPRKTKSDSQPLLRGEPQILGPAFGMLSQIQNQHCH